MKAIYFDIGGTYVRVEVIKNGRSLFYKKIRTPKKLAVFILYIKNTVSALIKKYNCQQINFGVPGVIEGTRVMSCANIKYLHNFDLRKVVPTKNKITVDNDARLWLKRVISRNTKLNSGTVLGLIIGTGVGRAVAVNGRVRTIRRFEYAEKWERAYQRSRFRNSAYLTGFLLKKLTPLITKYQPEIIVFGGGVIKRKKDLGRQLKKAFTCSILVS